MIPLRLTPARTKETTTTTQAGEQQPVTKRTFTAICAYCNMQYQAEKEWARYCCPAHKQAAYRERKNRHA